MVERVERLLDPTIARQDKEPSMTEMGASEGTKPTVAGARLGLIRRLCRAGRRL